jgi:signal transduction histidine kinase
MQSSNAQDRQRQIKRFVQLDSMIEKTLSNHPDQAMAMSNEQMQIATALQNDSMHFSASLNKAATLGQMAIYDDCISILYELLKKATDKNKLAQIIEVKNKMGATYFNMSDMAKSAQYYREAKEACILNKQYKDTASINSELGLLLVIDGQSDKGIAMQKQSIATLKAQGLDKETAIAIDNLSNSYYNLDSTAIAIQYQLQLFDYKYITDNIEGETGVNQHLAELYIEAGEYDKAQKYVTEAIKYGLQMHSHFWLFDCYKNQAAIYEAKGDYKNALHYHQLYLASKDSVYQTDYANKMSALHNYYELTQKQNKINNLAKDKAIASSKIQRLTLLIVILALLSLLSFVYLLYRKNKNDKLLKEQFAKQLLSSQEEERQRIAKDLHDSLGQNILFIKNQLANPQRNEESLMKSIDAAIEEVRNISKDLYPNQLEKYGLASAVQALSEQVNQSTGIFVSSDIQGIDEVLNKNVKINFYRIIQEFVNNSVKHAQASSIRITANQTEKEIVLVVQDNGKGFDIASLQSKAQKSFGLLNMEERIKMLKGKVDIKSDIGKGTKSTFTIPI